MKNNPAMQGEIANSFVRRTYETLGGKNTIQRLVHNEFEVHDLLISGLPSKALFYLIESLSIPDGYFEITLGMSWRTIQRRKADSELLQTDQSSRVWKFAEIFGRATEIFGGKDAAREWLMKPAIGLENRKPIDLLATAAGREAVEDYMTRIEYGVYT